MSSQLVSLNFDYTDPYPGFDKSTIKGLVAELITIPKDKLDSSLALEITAGGRLYNVRNNNYYIIFINKELKIDYFNFILIYIIIINKGCCRK